MADEWQDLNRPSKKESEVDSSLYWVFGVERGKGPQCHELIGHTRWNSGGESRSSRIPAVSPASWRVSLSAWS
jgi:hypothetical protein